MNFDCDKLVEKTSFHFIAFQGMLFLTIAIIGLCISSIELIIHQDIGFTFFFLNWFFLTILALSCLSIYTFVVYFIFTAIRKQNFVFNKFFIFYNVILYMLIYWRLLSEHIATLTGAGIYLLFILPTISISFIIFTLIPYGILLLKEKYKKISVKNSVFCKNRVFLFYTVVGISLYILACILCLCFTMCIII